MASFLFTAIAVVLHLAGVGYALHAILHARTPKSAIAWAIVLVQFPYIALPVYWIFGRYRFDDYIASRRRGKSTLQTVTASALKELEAFRVHSSQTPHREYFLREEQIGLPLTRGNELRLLQNGEHAYREMFRAIDAAKDYVLLEFFIIRADNTGEALKQKLIRKAREGVRVYFLYDEIGCYFLPSDYITELVAGGVTIHKFGAAKWGNPFQINFRNHRKLVIVDGKFASLGGINIGDEYTGTRRKFSPWRDTNVAVSGPAVQCCQITFLEDWYWATQQVPSLCWSPAVVNRGGSQVLSLPTGPADRYPLCCYSLLRLFNAARAQLWISTPYFVPDDALSAALKLAAMRGVDVRIILPDKADHKLVYLSSFAYLEEMLHAGVKFYRYRPGFIHQKVILVDDTLAAIGSVNLDNRSVYLDFELTLIAADKAFAAIVRHMLEADLRHCRQLAAGEYADRSLSFKLLVAMARLLDPIQ